MSMTDGESGKEELRERILRSTLQLISEGGADAATTRSVAAAAGVQAPAIYRLFGDKRGLLDATAAYAVTRYVSGKGARKALPDPVDDLRHGWDRHVAFGLAHPAVFVLMRSDSPGGAMSEALEAGERILRAKVHRVALAGRLRVTEERAITLMHATGVGIIEALLAQPYATRDLELSALAREAMLAAITTRNASGVKVGAVGAANALRASLDELTALSNGERALMGELLERIARAKP
jgi:AcrR family transcriptional regulator